MMRRWQRLAVVGLLCVGLTAAPRAVRADEAGCIAATENEVGLRKQQKLRDAMKLLAVCAAPECPAEIRAECSRRLVVANAALPTIVLGATDAAGNDLIAVTVTIDGVPLTRAMDGRALPVDPGSHVLRFESAGKPPVEKTVVIGEGVKDRHVAVVMGAAAAPVVAPPAVAPAAPPAPVAPLPPPSSPQQPPADAPPATGSSEGGGVRSVGYVVAAVGLAGVAVGGVFGGLAMSKASSAKGECTGGSCASNTNPAAHSDMQTASTYATVSTATFIGGGALLATGVVLALAGGAKHPATGLRWSPSLVAHGGGLTLAGGW